MVKLELKMSQRLMLKKLVDELPLLNYHNGPWLAGGSVRSVAAYEDLAHVKDLDIFCADEGQAIEVRDALHSNGFKRGHDHNTDVGNPDQDAYWAFHKKGFPHIVQLVVGWYKPTAQETIEDFSITACQFITDGVGIWAGDLSIYHVHMKWFWPVQGSRIGTSFVHKYFEEYGYKDPGGKDINDYLATADHNRRS